MRSIRAGAIPLETSLPTAALEGPEPRARLSDLIGLAPLLLLGFGFWTVTGLVFAGEAALLQAHAGISQPWYRLVAEQLASWWPCVLLTPPAVAVTLWARRPRARVSRMAAIHALGAALFLTVGGALMGLAESLLPWAARDGGPHAAAGWGILRYVGTDMQL
jgi:hypothetical protein